MPDLALGQLTMGLLGGLALFLFGMQQMTDALKVAAGAGLRSVLGRLTGNRFAAAFTGACVTAVIQSSSVTSVLVVGFVTAGLMTLPQSIGVIMGANIGTTVTAQIIAFSVTEHALAIIAAGFAMMFILPGKRWRQYGAMIFGLGLVFVGMGVMSDATRPLRTFEPFIDAMRQMDEAWLAILVAAGFTALVQSSSATTGIVIVLAGQGFITLEAGIALIFGANIGTCVTAVLAAIGKPAEAKQAAGVHLVFNVLGVLIWLPFIEHLAMFVNMISPAAADVEGAARLAADTPRQIANAHTIFNIANTVIFIWFTGPLAWVMVRVIRKRPEKTPAAARPQHLDPVYLPTPPLALDAISRETVRLGEQVIELAADARRAIVAGSEQDLDAIVVRAEYTERLYDAISDYVRQLTVESLTSDDSRRLNSLTAVAAHIQNASETIALNFTDIGRERLEHRVHFGAHTLEQISDLGAMVREAMRLAIQSIEDPSVAPQVIAMKPDIQTRAAETFEHLMHRLRAGDPNRAVLFRLESHIVEMLQRLYYFAKKIAKTTVRPDDSAVAPPPSEGDDGAVADAEANPPESPRA